MTSTLQQILDPIGRQQFREQYHRNRPLLIRGHAEKFAHLFAWEDVNRFLNVSHYPNPYVHLMAAGTSAEKAASSPQVIERSRAGATIRITRLERLDPKVGELARSLEAEMGEQVKVTFFLSQSGRAGTSCHYDPWDVFVLHLDGHKAWRVFEPALDEPGRPSLECELSPGDLLYIPRGHWHQAMAQRGPSRHLSVILVARTGIAFLTWLTDELKRDVLFRRELPLMFADDPPERREERLREHIAKLTESLALRLQDHQTMKRFGTHCVMSDRDVHPFKLPAQLLEAPAQQLAVRRFSRPARQRVLLRDEPADDQIALCVWGQELHFPNTAKRLIEFLVSRTGFSCDDAIAHAGPLTEQGVWDVLNRLLREGILEPEPEA